MHAVLTCTDPVEIDIQDHSSKYKVLYKVLKNTALCDLQLSSRTQKKSKFRFRPAMSCLETFPNPKTKGFFLGRNTWGGRFFFGSVFFDCRVWKFFQRSQEVTEELQQGAAKRL